MDQEPKIGTIDNGLEYIGEGKWQDTEDQKVYDSSGQLIREPKRRRLLSDFYHNLFCLD